MSSEGLVSLFLLEGSKSVNNGFSGLIGFDDVINKSSLGGLEWVGELVLVVLDFLLHVLSSEDNLDGTLGSHDGDFGSGPGVV